MGAERINRSSRLEREECTQACIPDVEIYKDVSDQPVQRSSAYLQGPGEEVLVDGVSSSTEIDRIPWRWESQKRRVTKSPSAAAHPLSFCFSCSLTYTPLASLVYLRSAQQQAQLHSLHNLHTTAAAHHSVPQGQIFFQLAILSRKHVQPQ